MPYVAASLRAEVDPFVNPVLRFLGAGSAGLLNYLVTKLVIAFLGASPGYERYNAAVGVLEAAKMELYARRVRPYEDRKIAVNGDVYPEEVR
jgi:hypothetical protein